MQMELLRAENVNFTYPEQNNPALDTVSITVQQGSFHVICGASGCGKTTLIRMLKPELRPKGKITGNVLYNGINITDLKSVDNPSEKGGDANLCTASEIGFVRQAPEQQIVTDKVWHELAFGLENLGVSREQIRVRVGEIANYFGIQNWFRQETMTLSGGQKQLLNLAAVMVMQPKVLILDEPTSQLDPIAASEFLHTVARLNRELGITILMVEHRLEQVLPLCDTISLMDSGKVLFTGTPREAVQYLTADGANDDIRSRMLQAFPTATRMYHVFRKEQKANEKQECPISVTEGRTYLRQICDEKSIDKETTVVEQYNAEKFNKSVDCNKQKNVPSDINANAVQKKNSSVVPALELTDVYFRYEKDSVDILRGLNFRLEAGEVYGLLGGNGAGKTTMLQVLSGLKKAYHGKITIFGKRLKEYKNNRLYRGTLAYLPQDPTAVFVKDTVREDLEDYYKALGLSKEDGRARLTEADAIFDIAELLDKHPYDLSGGEQQRCALAKVLTTKPRILLLDEPTKGLDAYGKTILGERLQKLAAEGISILLVTHDVEFAAEYCHRCGLFFDGDILSQGTPAEFFGGNQFYTTEAKRIAQGMLDGAVTLKQLINRARRQEEQE